jgi:hypothetical protein
MQNTAVIKEKPINIIMNHTAKSLDDIELEALKNLSVTPYPEVKRHLDSLAAQTAESAKQL